jgi:CheY-like chemotaxis protein
MNILVVDDDADLRRVLIRLLGKRGHAVAEASSGNRAIAALKADPSIDLILSDVAMPDGGGRELLTFVRGAHPTKPKFVLMTGYSDLTADEARKLGAQDLLLKPFELADFLRAHGL